MRSPTPRVFVERPFIALVAAGLAVAACGNAEAVDELPRDQQRASAAPLRDSTSELHATAHTSAPLTALVGSYRHIGGEEEARVLSERIESIASSFSVVARGIVRKSLVEATAIPAKIVITADARTITIHNGATNSNSLDGPPVSVAVSNGEMMDLTYAVPSSAEITESFQGKGRGRVNRYVLDGDKLTVHVRIHAAELPHDLVYELTYERIAETKLAGR